MRKHTLNLTTLFAVLGLVAGCAAKSATPVAAAPTPTPAADPGVLLEQVRAETAGPARSYVKATADSVDTLLVHARAIDMVGGIDDEDRLHAEAIAELLLDHEEIEVTLQPAEAPATEPEVGLALQMIAWAETLELQQALVEAGAPAARIALAGTDEDLDDSWSRLDFTADEGVKVAFRRATNPGLAYDFGDDL